MGPTQRSLPTVIVTGAGGFVGRRLLEGLKDDFRVEAIDRRSRHQTGGPEHPSIRWHQIDLNDRRALEEVFRQVTAEAPTVASLVHLAAYFDFTGELHPEYWMTNVRGLRSVLDAARQLELEQLVFASSLAACPFPSPGEAITESTPPEGEHLYARTKKAGEEMLAEYRDAFPSVVVRFAAMFSDWCEYPPLFFFLETWLSDRWNAHMLGGKGRSAVPYLHVRDAVAFLRAVIAKRHELEPGVVLSASPDGAISHRELYEAATGFYYDTEPPRPIFIPKPLCKPGMWGRDVLGRLLGSRPFERPWMADYIDLSLTADASWTRRRLGWAPRRRLEILQRMPFLVENLRTDPVEWHRRNHEALEVKRLHPNLRLYDLLEVTEDDIVGAFLDYVASPEGRERLPSYHVLEGEQHRWNLRFLMHNLKAAVRTREKGVFKDYCRGLAERRAAEGVPGRELCRALVEINRRCLEALSRHPEGEDLGGALHDDLTMTIWFGIDQIEETYEELGRGMEAAENLAGAEELAGEVPTGCERPRRRRTVTGAGAYRLPVRSGRELLAVGERGGERIRHLEGLLVALVAAHSVAVGVMLTVLTPWAVGFAGWEEVTPLFFPRQAGVFHFVVAFAYLYEYWRLRGVTVLVTTKALAAAFLVAVALEGELAWSVIVSGVADALMGVTVLAVHLLARVRRRHPGG